MRDAVSKWTIACAAILVAAAAGCETAGTWTGAFDRTAKGPRVVGYVDADAHGNGRAVVVRYAAPGVRGEADAYAVLPADDQWRTAWSSRATEGVTSADIRYPADRARDPRISGAAGSVAAAGPITLRSTRPSRRFVRASTFGNEWPVSADGRLYLVPYWPPGGPPIDPNDPPTAPRWLVVSEVADRPPGQRVGVPIGLAAMTPFTLAYDVGTFPLVAFIWGSYTIATWGDAVH